MKILRMNDEQARVVEDILAGALEDIEGEVDESTLGDAFAQDCARKVKLLRPIVDAFTATHVAETLTDEEKL